MDQLIARAQKLNINDETVIETETEYAKAFVEIVHFVEDCRSHKEITPNELAVTKALAGPFTQGGPMVLLLEPRRWHPWDSGVDAVIEECRTLQVLDHGFKLVSEGSLSLTNGVSVLDLRPFLAKDDHTELTCKWEHLYDLVYEAIAAKKPDVLLCMGKVRGNILNELMLTASLHETGRRQCYPTAL